MNTLFRKKPSPSMIVAMVALFVALSGGAYAGVALNQVRSVHIKNGEVKAADLAASAVTNAKIANNAVNSNKVAADTLTGADINEASLSTVPSATSATTASSATTATSATTAATATSATSAESAGGITPKKVLFVGNAATPVANQEILSAGGLKLLASCAAGPTLTLNAQTTLAPAFIKSTIQTSNGAYTDGVPAGDNRGGDQVLQDDTFNVGETLELLDNAITASDSVTTTVSYTAPGGSVVEVHLQAEEGTLLGATGACIVSGVAFIG